MLKNIFNILCKTESSNKPILHHQYGLSFKPFVKPNLPKTPTVTTTTSSLIPKK